MDQQYSGQAGGQPPLEPGGYPGQPSYQTPEHPGQPYQPPSYSQGAYAPPPGEPAPPPQKKPFNWLACCGISCGVALLFAVLSWVIALKTCGGFIGPLMQIGKVGQEVQRADPATVAANAQPVDAASLSAAPDAYRGQWLALEGVLGNPNDPMAQEMASQSGQSGTAYFLTPNILVMDISGAASVGAEGDSIRAYGKAVKLDLKEMLKFLGPAAIQDMESDPQMQGRTTLVMFFARQVELVSEAAVPDAAGDSAAMEAAEGAAAGDVPTGWE